MTRIAGVELQDSRKLNYALTKIKGIGWALSEEIIKDLGMDTSKKVSDLTPNELSKLTSHIEKYPIEGELLRQVKANIQRLKTIGSYRGMRHTRNLPVRGQRTRSNARTKRGKRKTVGAFRKEVLTKTQPQKATRSV